MNWNDIKKGLTSKPARIIYAIIVIAAIMTAVGFGIYYLYGLLTQGACQPGQFYYKSDGVCYPGECANDCEDDNAERNWNKENKFKLVTHHWGNNINKGYQVYKKIDMLLDDPLWNKKIEFTFIGNLHQSIKFKNVKNNNSDPLEQSSNRIKALSCSKIMQKS